MCLLYTLQLYCCYFAILLTYAPYFKKSKQKQKDVQCSGCSIEKQSSIPATANYIYPTQKQKDAQCSECGTKKQNSIPTAANYSDLKHLLNFSHSPFYIAHVLDPNAEGHSHVYWNRREWLDWYGRRELMLTKANDNHGMPLTKKGLNSVVISPVPEFLKSFESRQYPCNLQSPIAVADKNKDVYWSESRFSTVLFERGKRKRNNIRVYRSSPMYIAAKLDKDNIPLHFHAQSRRRNNENRFNVTKDCVQIK